MGEAWFMSETRRMYDELMGDPDTIPIELLEQALWVIASGTSSFGHRDEWHEWFHYLLALSIGRARESTRAFKEILGTLITAFITQYPGGVALEPYQGFRVDALNTLGRCVMDPSCWPKVAISAQHCLDRFEHRRTGRRFWFQVSPILSASLFFCLKYLRSVEIGPWTESLLRIQDTPWRAELIVWFVGVRGVFSGATLQPAQFDKRSWCHIGWEWSDVLTGNYSGDLRENAETTAFIPEANLLTMQESVAAFMTEAVFLDWLGSIASEPAIENDLGDLPFQFFEFYGAKPDENVAVITGENR